MAANTNLVCILLLSVFGQSIGDRCPGYTDPFGDYVEAFDCPRPDYWADDPDETYCCISSSGTNNFCCDEYSYETFYNDSSGSGWSTTYTVVIVIAVLIAFVVFSLILRAVIRRRSIRQGPAVNVSPPGHYNPYAENDVTYHPPPPPPIPMQSATTSPPPPNAPPANYYEARMDDPPPPYPGYPVPPLGDENGKPE
ncbi:uncharacterized protein C19C7.05-like [Patiria miniata]|uniref:Uncharacterized protein n=1 Tax=Patiria miniata TaxID=46514 RepID=A0A914BA54_PATMI|nr:uncharacterized protein C19C7.05-like [Patiria miniata]